MQSCVMIIELSQASPEEGETKSCDFEMPGLSGELQIRYYNFIFPAIMHLLPKLIIRLIQSMRCKLWEYSGDICRLVDMQRARVH